MQKQSTSVKVVKNLALGCLTAMFTQPFQLLRTSAIKSSHSDARVGLASFLSLFRTILKQEGIMGLFRGTSYNVAKSGTTAILFFSGLDFFTPIHRKLFNIQDRKQNSAMLFLESIVIAASSKFITVLTVNPIIVLKTNYEVSGTERVQFKELISRIYSQNGVRGFFRGIGLTLLRDVPWSSLQFAFYRFLIRLHEQLVGGERSGGFVFAAGAGTSLLATLLVYPFDNLRVRKQTDPEIKSSLSLARRTLREEGIRGLYRGIEPRLVKKGLSGGVLWTIYKVLFQNQSVLT